MAVPETGETRYARNGEVRIAFTDLGGAGGEPLLLIMGLAVSRFWWPPHLADELVRRGASPPQPHCLATSAAWERPGTCAWAPWPGWPG
jgi:hypothetical protein